MILKIDVIDHTNHIKFLPLQLGDKDLAVGFPGEIIMQGDKFRLTMMAIEAAYDGKTMYMYNPDVDELTLSNPDEQELLQANPFLYAKALVNVCNIVEKASGDNTLITLTPKDQSIGINRFVLKLRTADLMPLSIELKEGKKMTTLKLKEPKFVSASQKWEYIKINRQ